MESKGTTDQRNSLKKLVSKDVKTMDPHALAKELHTSEENYLLLDCRPILAFNSCHIAGTVLVIIVVVVVVVVIVMVSVYSYDNARSRSFYRLSSKYFCFHCVCMCMRACMHVGGGWVCLFISVRTLSNFNYNCLMKLSTVGPAQYLDGCPPGNSRCCRLSPFFLLFFTPIPFFFTCTLMKACFAFTLCVYISVCSLSNITTGIEKTAGQMG